MYNQLENGTGVMIDCGGDPEIKIDRYDGRALLDFLPNSKEPPKEASEMDNVCISHFCVFVFFVF